MSDGYERTLTSPEWELWEALDGLPPETRAALFLRFSEDVDLAGVAESLDETEAQVQTRIEDGVRLICRRLHCRGFPLPPSALPGAPRNLPAVSPRPGFEKRLCEILATRFLR